MNGTKPKTRRNDDKSGQNPNRSTAGRGRTAGQQSTRFNGSRNQGNTANGSRDESRDVSRRGSSSQAGCNRREQFGVQYSSSFDLERLIRMSSDDLVNTLMKQKTSFEQLLNGKFTPDLMVATVRVLAILCRGNFTDSVTSILTRACSNTFLESVENFLTSLPFERESDARKRNKLYWENIDGFWQNLEEIFQKVTNLIPSKARDELTGVLSKTNVIIANIESNQDYAICRNIKDSLSNMSSSLQKQLEKFDAKTAAVREVKPKVEEKDPPENFRFLSVVPMEEDLFDSDPFIRANRVTEPYESVEHYLDVQFRLLREDFIGPFRDGVNEYLGEPTQRRNKNVQIYRRVTFLPREQTKRHSGYTVFFGIKKIDWNDSKRLMFGELLCLSKDDFQTFFFATVTEPDPRELKQGILHIKLCEQNLLPHDFYNHDFVMLESKVYFGPYFVVLNALRHMYERNFPMKIYLVDADTSVKRPSYLEDEKIELAYQGFELPVDVNKAWPSPEELKLDEMQYKAFKCALTEEFTVIQGPPGTGKTFLALEIIRTMLSNSMNWYGSGPIIILCLTNHALDQFLEGILNYTSSIVRIGSQSKSSRLEKRNIKILRPEPKPRPPSNVNVHKFEDKRGAHTDHYRSMKHTYFDEYEENYEEYLEYLRYLTYRECLAKWEAKYSLALISAHAHVGRAQGQLNAPLRDMKVTQDIIWNLNKENGLVSVKQLARYCEDPSLIKLRTNEALLKWLLGDNFITRKSNHAEISWQEELSERLLSQWDSSIAFPLECIDEIIAEIQSEIASYKKGSKVAHELPFNPTANWKFDIYELRTLRSSLERNLAHHPLVQRENQANCKHPHWQSYWQWVTVCHEAARRELPELESDTDHHTLLLNETKEKLDLQIMKEHRVVGLTTTAAARMHSSLRALKAPIVLVEEAAEILEAHIVCSLTDSCQHMILIGDHKQLRPKTAVYKLGTKYNLNISLFERMVNIRGNHTQLTRQHRMRPEIAKLLCPAIYKTLHNHESVCKYPSVKGLTKNVFFLHHTNREVVSDFNEDSWTNPYEAKFLMALARHLTLQGYDVSEVTILCTYAGQLTNLKQEKDRYPILQDLRLKTIDNFQGEENKIILLSLVRNNKEGNIGFLREENRVCVALSRAREGLYVVGNIDNLTVNNTIWPKIKQVLEDDNAIGNSLELRCHMHPENITHAREVTDFDKCPEGGCLKNCNAELSCGHVCQMICHILNQEHEDYKCMKPCLQVCPRGHPCPLTCWQGCESCLVLEDRELKCGHIVLAPCGAESDTYPCPVMIDAILPDCNHMVNKPCHKPVKNYPCSHPCEVRLPCGHTCTLTCHMNNDPDHLEYKCKKECTKNNRNCTMDHPCTKQCGEQCTLCEFERKKKRSCGHYFKCKCSQDVEEISCTKPCKRRIDCGHACQLACNEICGKCQVKVEKMSSCGHKMTVKCCEEATPSNCSDPCERMLACGHSCLLKCKDPCSTTCRNMIQQTKPGLCGHLFSVPCHIKDCGDPHQLLRYCKEPCNTELACGHICKGNCGTCKQGRIHTPCAENCGNILICGHKCEVPCRQECPPCKKVCEVKCRHNKCNRKCGEPCVPCKEKCGWSCPHSECSKLCSELCDREPCNEPCQIILPCNHPCIGFCGEPCPKLCRICNEEELLNEFFLGHEDEPDARFILLEDCGHCIESQGLLQWVSQCSESIQMKTCPRCKTLIRKCMRIMNQIKTDVKDVQLIKKKIFGDQVQLQNEQQLFVKEIELMVRNPVLKVFSDLKNFVDTLKSKVRPVTKKKQRQVLDVRATEATKITINILQQMFRKLENIEDTVKIYPWLQDQISMLVQSLSFRGQISNQEIDDIEPELRRLHYMAEICKLNSETIFESNDSANHEVTFIDLVEKLTSIEKFSESRESDIKNEIGKLAPVMEMINERKMIVKAMGFKQGHWFKCPNGHIYSIGECGGAMQQSKCNECGAAIGGTQHRLTSDNSLATEMDGATRSAWPSAT